MAELSALTLTTFADVPWNAPYYVRCGFRVLEDREVTAGLRAIWQREASFGMTGGRGYACAATCDICNRITEGRWATAIEL